VEGDRLRHELRLFGYGSLAADVLAAGVPARLPGWRLTWGVAMDNAVDLPAYKCYLAADGSRPDVCVAFLDIEPDPHGEVEGLCVDVGERELPALDARERNYERVAVDADGAAWAYAGRADSRARYAAAARDGRCVIARPYLESVRSGLAAALGEAAAARVDEAARRSGLPVAELRRVDLP
jgi:hypothetical protein